LDAGNNTGTYEIEVNQHSDALNFSFLYYLASIFSFFQNLFTKFVFKVSKMTLIFPFNCLYKLFSMSNQGRPSASKTRQQIANEYEFRYTTLWRKLKKHSIEMPKVASTYLRFFRLSTQGKPEGL
jgi:hypothetical protein